ncbi:dockerin type I domain-containing protein [Erysipelothrix anatis]|uniref:dockerin type I domain-containing protein n=1 Tax=Erysipelothrix anatis TaxID=2683713 RepID=UPI0013577434|nr:dockerin type I domain-containing protein [Erysipelothrix anatis]
MKNSHKKNLKKSLKIFLALTIMVSMGSWSLFALDGSNDEDKGTVEKDNAIEPPVQSQDALENSMLEVIELEPMALEEPKEAWGGDTEGVEAAMQARAASTYAKSGFIQFNLAIDKNINLYDTATDSSPYRYLSGHVAYSGVVPFYDATDDRYKITISGIEGWVPKSAFKEFKVSEAKGANYYSVRNGNLYNNISMGAATSNYGTILNGPAPSYLKEDVRYFSADGHYFYTNVNDLILDYRSGGNYSAVNKSTPFYNYYQFLSFRSESSITADQLNAFLRDRKGFTSAPTNWDSMTSTQSKLYGSESAFVDLGRKYGTNPLMNFGVSINETGWGRSWLAVDRNNVFGHNATDSSPWLANSYDSVPTAVDIHYTMFLNWLYMDFGESSFYYGGYLGDKQTGINVKYSSDPFWGQKAAAFSYEIDRNYGNQDYGRYSIGESTAQVVPIRKEPSTGSQQVMKTEIVGQKVMILDTVQGESVNGNATWYKIAADSLLNSDRDRLAWITGGANRTATYDRSNNYLYIHSSNVRKVFDGKGSPVTPEPEFPRGDINGDGKVSVVDFAMMKSHLEGVRTLTGDQLKRADLNNDGKVTVIDFAMLKSHLEGIRPL